MSRNFRDSHTRRRMASAHAKYSHCCSCGMVVRGNGGKTQHPEMHARKQDGHHLISSDEHSRRFPLYGRCVVAGCMFRPAGKPSITGGRCENHPAKGTTAPAAREGGESNE